MAEPSHVGLRDLVKLVDRAPIGLRAYSYVEGGAPIPAGFRIVKTIPKGWSKANCFICQERIGPGHQPFGYRDARDMASGLNSLGRWLCERDYERYAARHDLGFLLDC
jgi:hypothetical protein